MLLKSHPLLTVILPLEVLIFTLYKKFDLVLLFENVYLSLSILLVSLAIPMLFYIFLNKERKRYVILSLSFSIIFVLSDILSHLVLRVLIDTMPKLTFSRVLIVAGFLVFMSFTLSLFSLIKRVHKDSNLLDN